MIDEEDLSDTAELEQVDTEELELIPTAELRQLLEPSDSQSDEEPQIEDDSNRGFDPYNRA
jgi:hypothetical protein